MMYYFNDWDGNDKTFYSLKECIKAAKEEGITKVRDFSGSEYFI